MWGIILTIVGIYVFVKVVNWISKKMLDVNGKEDEWT